MLIICSWSTGRVEAQKDPAFTITCRKPSTLSLPESRWRFSVRYGCFCQTTCVDLRGEAAVWGVHLRAPNSDDDDHLCKHPTLQDSTFSWRKDVSLSRSSNTKNPSVCWFYSSFSRSNTRKTAKRIWVSVCILCFLKPWKRSAPKSWARCWVRWVRPSFTERLN